MLRTSMKNTGGKNNKNIEHKQKHIETKIIIIKIEKERTQTHIKNEYTKQKTNHKNKNKT